MKHEIWTIGHSVHPFHEFITWLKEFQIELIADVRSFPDPDGCHGPIRRYLKESLPMSVLGMSTSVPWEVDVRC